MLQDKNKTMKSSTIPWRSLSDGLNLLYLVPISEVSDKLKSLNTKLTEVGPYEFVDIAEYCPSDPKERYLY